MILEARKIVFIIQPYRYNPDQIDHMNPISIHFEL